MFAPEATSENVSSRFRRLADRLGIVGLRFHDLRHSWGTNASRGGAPWHAIKKQGGWKTDAAASRYVNPDHLDLIEAVDGARGRTTRK